MRTTFSLAAFLVGMCCSVPATAGFVFLEDFGTLANGTAITTSNTNFDYVRTGGGGGAIEALNPSNFTGSALNLGGSSSTSLNGVGLTTGLGNNNMLAFEIDLRTTNSTLGDLVLTSGQGSTFTGNSPFTTAQLFFGIQIDNGNLEYRTGAWNSTGFSLANDTNYSLGIYANNSGAAATYASGSVANGTMDIVVNGAVVANDVAFANNVTADAFRIYQVNGSQTYQLDNISIRDSLAAVPEPSCLALLAAGGLGGIFRRRR